MKNEKEFPGQLEANAVIWNLLYLEQRYYSLFSQKVEKSFWLKQFVGNSPTLLFTFVRPSDHVLLLNYVTDIQSTTHRAKGIKEGEIKE